MDVTGSVVSATAVVDWTDILGSGAFAEGMTGELIIRVDSAVRVAVGVADPVASTTAGSLLAANKAAKIMLGQAATQSIWVQHLADQVPVQVQLDDQGIDEVFVVVA